MKASSILRTSITVSLLAAGVAVTGMLAARSAEPAAPAIAPMASSQATTFQVDAVHSAVVFRVGHLGVAKFWGRFNSISGSFAYDEADPAASMFDFTVATESVDTGNEARDRHLKSPDFFNAREHPNITFQSTAIEPASSDKWNVTGDLSLHGVTKSVTASIEWIGEGQTRQGFKRGFEATFTIKRSEFGMSYGLENEAVGDEVKLIVAVEGVNK